MVTMENHPGRRPDDPGFLVSRQLGQWLKQEIEARQLKHTDIAKAAQISRQHLYKIYEAKVSLVGMSLMRGIFRGAGLSFPKDQIVARWSGLLLEIANGPHAHDLDQVFQSVKLFSTRPIHTKELSER